jgi:hypothetical protein
VKTDAQNGFSCDVAFSICHELIHDGAAHLRVVTAPTRMLEGEYLMGPRTKGTMKPAYRTKEFLEAFPEVL